MSRDVDRHRYMQEARMGADQGDDDDVDRFYRCLSMSRDVDRRRYMSCIVTRMGAQEGDDDDVDRLHYSFGHVWSMYRSSPFPSTFEHGLHYSFGHVVWSMYQSSPFRSTLNTGYITALDMCEVCTEAVHSVALWTRVTLQLWTCVKHVPKQSIP